MFKHLKEQEETYAEHMYKALTISYMLFIMSIMCFAHSLLPFLFTNSVSSRMEKLQKIVFRE